VSFERALGDQFLRETETPKPFMNPTHEWSLDRLPDKKLSHLLQNRAHYTLASYLNNSTEPSTELVRRVANRLDVPLPQDDAHQTLIAAYQWLESSLPDDNEGQQILIEEYDPASYTSNDLEREIRQIAEQLTEIDDLLASAVLHGSFGDRTYVENYSDVDLLVVVNRESLEDRSDVERIRDTLQEVQRRAYYVDPHQHHGVMVVTDLDMRAYNRAYLPPEVISRGTTLCGNSTPEFSHRDDKLERTYGLWRNVQRLRRTVDEGEFPVAFQGHGNLKPDLSGHLYSLKYFTSFVMLQPSMYLMADGRPMYKADSFDAVPDLGEHGTIIDQCSEIRRRYPNHVTFDRSDAYRRRLRENQEAARGDQQSTIPPAFHEILDGRPFERALELIEHLWTMVT